MSLGLAQPALAPHAGAAGGDVGVVEDGGRNTPRDRSPPLSLSLPPSLMLRSPLQRSLLAPRLRRNNAPILRHLAPAADASLRASRRRFTPIGPRR